MRASVRQNKYRLIYQAGHDDCYFMVHGLFNGHHSCFDNISRNQGSHSSGIVMNYYILYIVFTSFPPPSVRPLWFLSGVLVDLESIKSKEADLIERRVCTSSLVPMSHPDLAYGYGWKWGLSETDGLSPALLFPSLANTMLFWFLFKWSHSLVTCGRDNGKEAVNHYTVRPCVLSLLGRTPLKDEYVEMGALASSRVFESTNGQTVDP